MAVRLSIILFFCMLSLAMVSAGGGGGHHKKVIIHVPYKVHVNHHHHTIYKTIHHIEKEKPKEEKKHGDDYYEVLGYTYGKEEPSIKEESGGLSNFAGFSFGKEESAPIPSFSKGVKDPHKISSYIRDYNSKGKGFDYINHQKREAHIGDVNGGFKHFNSHTSIYH